MGDNKISQLFFILFKKMEVIIMRKKINKNENGISAWSIIGIILIGLIIWQFTGNYLGIGTPTDLLSTDPSEITHHILIQDSVTGETWENIDEIWKSFEIEYGHTYNLKLNTNAPYKFSGEQYHLVWEVKYHNLTSDAIEIIGGARWDLPWTGIFSNSFKIPIPVYYPDIKYIVQAKFYNPDGIQINYVEYRNGDMW